MTTRIQKAVFCLFVPLLLLACGSSPQVRWFSLSSMESAYQPDGDEAVVLGLGPLRMPEYLNRSQMVTRGAGAELQVDEFNRWAEPFAVAVHRVIAEDVDKLVTGATVIAFPYDSRIRSHVDYRLIGDVTRFEADMSGRVVLELQWGISSTDSEIVVKPGRRRYETQVSATGDAAAVADAMNRALGKFARDIAASLEAVLARKD